LLIFLFFFTSFTQAADVQKPVTHVEVIKESVNILEEADLNSRILKAVSRGTTLEVKETVGDWYRVVVPLIGVSYELTGFVHQDAVKETTVEPGKEGKKKDQFFLIGMAMLRVNWASVDGDEMRYRYSDLGMPADFSTRERVSLMMEGTFGDGKYSVDGFLNYDPEYRITEPPLEFLVNVGNEKMYLSVGDYRQGVMLDSIFSRYYHPFRGGVIGARSDRFGVEVMGGTARGESGIEEFSAELGSGPYYLMESPILRGSEVVFLVTKSATNPDLEVTRTPMVRNKDYYIDYDRGSIIFTRTIYAWDEVGNPVSVMVTYQYESLVGRFTRAVFGLRAFVAPFKFLKLNLSYIADSDKDQDLGDIFENRRGIFSFGVNVDSEPVTLFGEFAFSSEPASDNQNSYFVGGIANISKKIHFYFNGWSLDSDFPTFANNQLQYGYSLVQIFPSYAERNIFLSPFQFTRNLGAELYPFSLARLSVDETEAHGFLEWEDKKNKVSVGYGTRKETSTDIKTNTLYVSSFHNGEKTKAWGKFGIENNHDDDKVAVDSRTTDVLFGVRQQVKKFSSGDVFVQVDYKRDWVNDFLDIYPDTNRQTYSVMAEYLTENEGFFAGYRKETLDEKDGDSIMDADIFEVGVRRHIYKGFLVDSRYRQEKSTYNGVDSSNSILSLGAGYESKKVRAMAKYEIQVNETGENEGRRKLWSFFLFGAPVKRMSVSLRYYRQTGKDEAPFSLTERSEEELNFRLLWRPWDCLNIYSQWRYDTNRELYPPLDRTKSNSVASVHGLKWKISKQMEFLANYKHLKIWGPIENWKNTAAAELGYLLFRHLRMGIGIERIKFEDPLNPDSNYRSTVGYFKLTALY
jgi:hypothetical protein